MKNITVFFKHLYRGSFCYLPNYGDHPGTPIVIMLIAALTVAAGWPGFIYGSICFLPIYLWGSYHRSVEDPEQK